EKLTAMLDAANASTEVMEAIAHDSREQASAIEEVNIAVRQMDEMTQHNAALVEETNAAIEQTEAEANRLDTIVEIFRIGRDQKEQADVPLKAANAGPSIGHRPYLSTGSAAIAPEWSQF